MTFAAATVMTINGIVYAFCAQDIEERLSRLPETTCVFVDLKMKIVAVEANDGMTHDKKRLEREIKD